MSAVKISEELLPWIDVAVRQLHDEFGVQQYRSRKAVVDAAVREFLKLHDIDPREAKA